MDFIKQFHGAHNGRLQGILNPAQAETCEPSLLKESVAAAKELDVPIHIHAGGNFREFLEILNKYRKPWRNISPIPASLDRARRLATWRSPAATRGSTIRAAMS